MMTESFELNVRASSRMLCTLFVKGISTKVETALLRATDLNDVTWVIPLSDEERGDLRTRYKDWGGHIRKLVALDKKVKDLEDISVAPPATGASHGTFVHTPALSNLCQTCHAPLLKPGQDAVGPAPSLPAGMCLQDFLESRRNACAGAPLLGEVQAALSQSLGVDALDLGDLEREHLRQ